MPAARRPRLRIETLAAILVLVVPAPAGAQAVSPESGTMHLTPAFLTLPDGDSLAYEEGLLFVPENRHATESKTIAVRFARVPARDQADGPPVFYLPGGPGSTLDPDELADEEGQEIIDFFTSVGDLVIVDQRGNVNVEALFMPEMQMSVRDVPLEAPGDPEALKKAYRDGFAAALRTWEARGVDLAGYDITNAVDDVNDLRAALGYEQIILRGNSFGSQWSLAFLQRYPEHVARALLGGIEPLDRTYDRPSDVWAAHRRVMALAEADSALQPYLPEEGLEAALRGLLDRLEASPERVVLQHPATGDSATITLGRYDFQAALKRFSPNYYTREGLKTWPRFVLEMLDGDFRYLAALTYLSRQADRTPLIYPLIDNSLGITAARDRELQADPAAALVGPINSFYYATREHSPTPVVDDTFRLGPSTEVPVLMIQGDLDRSTPVENALALEDQLSNGHLLYVENGTHMAIREVRQFHPEITAQVLEFLQTGDLEEVPERVRLPAPAFEPPGAGSMYEQALQLFGQLATDVRIPE